MHPPRRLPALDGLRGIAIALVLLIHYGRTGSMLGRIAGIGWVGVDLFFVLSGFLITGILLETRGQERYFRSFYARRVLRIFPLYYAYLAILISLPLSSGVTSWLGTRYLTDHQAWFWTHMENWLMAREGLDAYAVAQGYGQLWSLAVEEQFYLMWPVAIAFLPPRSMLRACAMGLLLLPLFRTLLALAGAPVEVLYVMTPTRMDPLLMGAAIAILVREGRAAQLRRPAIIAGAIGFAVIEISFGLTGTAEASSPYVFAWLISGLALFWGAVLVWTLRGGWWTRLVAWQPLRFLGKYSYALYLVQVPVAHLLWGFGYGPGVIGRLPHAALGISCSIALAYVSWHLWEKHWLALKSRFPRATAELVPVP